MCHLSCVAEQMHEPPLADQGASCAESAACALIVERYQNFLKFCVLF
jgi:hypothetical protein